MVQVPTVVAKGQQTNVAVAQHEAPEFERVDWKREPNLRKLYAWACVLLVASATTGYDGMLVNTSQQIELWANYFPEHDDPNLLGLLVNMYSIGSIVSFFVTPYVADHYGRKKAIATGCLFMILGGFITAFCNGYNMYIAGRFLLGFGNSFSQMSSPLLLTEICHPQHRGPVTAVYNCLWNLGALLVACIGWGTAQVGNEWSWRSITFIQIVPSLIQIVFIYWIPESPRYLLSKDRSEEALDILAYYHGGGNRDNTTVQFEYREIKETMRIEKEATRATGYLDFLRTKGNRWRLAILISLGVISQYSGNALFSNYMNIIYAGAGINDQNQKLGLSTGKTILDLIVTIFAALNVDRFGRRPLFLISVCGMVSSFVIWTICGAIYENSGESNTGSGYAQIVFIWLFGIFYDIGFSGLLVGYALEILPFHLRAKGMMIMNITVQAILALGNQTNPLAWANLPNHWNFMLFYTLWDFCELVFVYFFYVETKGPTLEEIARIFDGEHAVAHINIHQVEKDIHGSHHEDEITEKEMVSPKSAI
ncbi:general substrate transporter [Pseudomassariella vexata]|uniref:General substrate transporter n=1 Tax=Pseudomassariella vexata TaxID=1141098 RepID=A0A1Y2DRN2_9PEZI|nr:general substrate transporter [Pseudomassariella vexata]ORY61804.1 general substrate transporter [Pseudomassariella vexata]